MKCRFKTLFIIVTILVVLVQFSETNTKKPSKFRTERHYLRSKDMSKHSKAEVALNILSNSKGKEYHRNHRLSHGLLKDHLGYETRGQSHYADEEEGGFVATHKDGYSHTLEEGRKYNPYFDHIQGLVHGNLDETRAYVNNNPKLEFRRELDRLVTNQQQEKFLVDVLNKRGLKNLRDPRANTIDKMMKYHRFHNVLNKEKMNSHLVDNNRAHHQREDLRTEIRFLRYMIKYLQRMGPEQLLSTNYVKRLDEIRKKHISPGNVQEMMREIELAKLPPQEQKIEALKVTRRILGKDTELRKKLKNIRELRKTIKKAHHKGKKGMSYRHKRQHSIKPQYI